MACGTPAPLGEVFWCDPVCEAVWYVRDWTRELSKRRQEAYRIQGRRISE